MSGGIAVAYSGVHQAYQLALAAEELGRLDNFFCSVFAATGKWGGALAQLLGSDLLLNRRVDGLSPQKVRENPWPLLAHRCRARLCPAKANDWVEANGRFDRWVAQQLRRSACRVFVGVETCAAESLAVARERGMVRVLDCPGIESSFLDKLASEAAAEFGLTTASQADSHAMHERKRCELELADVVLVCSELQAQMLHDTTPSAKPQVVPLWVDTRFWQPLERQVAPRAGTLRALFVGKINLRKGIPYLVRATVACGDGIALTLVGSVDDEMKPFLKSYEGKIKLLPPCTKTELRKHYNQHDILILPSLGDSFGFVAMEAMACGLPVIVSKNCGAPVPDPAWRVPVMDSAAIAERLEHYAAGQQALEQDGQIAYQFARQFTPEHYRGQIKGLYRRLLG